jgi:hypothetical protein
VQCPIVWRQQLHSQQNDGANQSHEYVLHTPSKREVDNGIATYKSKDSIPMKTKVKESWEMEKSTNSMHGDHWVFA